MAGFGVTTEAFNCSARRAWWWSFLPTSSKGCSCFVDALGSEKEAVYFAFPFAMTHPQFQYEIRTEWWIRPRICIRARHAQMPLR